MKSAGQQEIPAVLRWGSLVWLAIWIPAYWRTWGAVNFLHLCDIAVALTCAGFIFRSRLLLSSQAVASLLVDGVWIADIAWKLAFHRYLLGGEEYMFDSHYSLFVRLLSLFHAAIPVLLLWTLWRIGYDRRAWLLQSAIALAVFIASRFTDPVLNMNYTFADPFFHRQWGSAPTHLLVIFAFMVFIVYVPTHFLLLRLPSVRPPA